MRKILQRNEKVELNSFIDEFVKARQKYFTPGQEWLEAELAEEKISVYMDKAQLEKDVYKRQISDSTEESTQETTDSENPSDATGANEKYDPETAVCKKINQQHDGGI